MDDVVPLAQALFAKLSAIRNFCLNQEAAEGKTEDRVPNTESPGY